MDVIADLEKRLAAALGAEDFETAEALKGAIDRLRSGQSSLRAQIPGRMGLGTSQEDYASAPRRSLPKKPDPMTANHKPGGRRR